MTEDGQTKVCPLCSETIRVTAKVCPHCRHWQKKWSLSNPYFVGTFAGVTWLLLCSCVLAFMGKVLGPKEEFATYRDQIGVVQSEFSQRTSGSNLWITVVGTLTNHSNIGWKDVGVEGQFFDPSGKLIDVISVNTSDYRAAVILPHGEAAFRIERMASHPASSYATNKLTVRWAKDVDAW
jgi:hypothetical protein